MHRLHRTTVQTQKQPVTINFVYFFHRLKKSGEKKVGEKSLPALTMAVHIYLGERRNISHSEK